jgi:hypothetical protein
MGDNGLLYLVIFYLFKLIPQEYNYKIYNKELLAIIQAFKEFQLEFSLVEPN